MSSPEIAGLENDVKEYRVQVRLNPGRLLLGIVTNVL
jgi:survival-of-motor-neuron-related-splicing factor 30